MKNESGAVLLIVLVALALLSALATLIIEVSKSDLSALISEQEIERRDLLIRSAMTVLGAQLPSRDFPENGSLTRILLPGGNVIAKIQSSSGLINPNFVSQDILYDTILTLGARPDQARSLTSGIVRSRGSNSRMVFSSFEQIARHFNDNLILWERLKPYITFLGRSETVDLARAPMALRGVAAHAASQTINLNEHIRPNDRGYYEIWLHVEDAALDASDPAGRLWTRVSALVGTDHRLHILYLGWPEPLREGN